VFVNKLKVSVAARVAKQHTVAFSLRVVTAWRADRVCNTAVVCGGLWRHDRV